MSKNSFRLFDVTRPGPGVNKNQQEKRPIIEFWEIVFRRFWDLLELGLLYAIFAIPIITIGLGNAGATFITRNYVRSKPVFLFSDYFSTMKKNWKQALPIGIVNTIVTCIMLFSAYFYSCYGTMTGYIFMSMVLILLLLFTVMKYYLYIMMVTFRFKFRQLYKNAFYLSFLGIKSNLMIMGVLFLVYGLFISVAMTLFYSNLVPFYLLVMVFAMIFLPTFRLLLIQFYTFPVVKKHLIDPYYKENPEEFEAVRHILNLENEETKKQDEEKAVFHDVVESQKKKSSIPKQYSENELKTLRKKTLSDEDDDTI